MEEPKMIWDKVHEIMRKSMKIMKDTLSQFDWYISKG
jgi:hypothetical protein